MFIIGSHCFVQEIKTQYRCLGVESCCNDMYVCVCVFSAHEPTPDVRDAVRAGDTNRPVPAASYCRHAAFTQPRSCRHAHAPVSKSSVLPYFTHFNLSYIDGKLHKVGRRLTKLMALFCMLLKSISIL